ncbi:MAG: hypothetical protein ACI8TP_003959 [Acidimicrobiales bacterium]|jgi:hypothetical protein
MSCPRQAADSSQVLSSSDDITVSDPHRVGQNYRSSATVAVGRTEREVPCWRSLLRTPSAAGKVVLMAAYRVLVPFPA